MYQLHKVYYKPDENFHRVVLYINIRSIAKNHFFQKIIFTGSHVISKRTLCSRFPDVKLTHGVLKIKDRKR